MDSELYFKISDWYIIRIRTDPYLYVHHYEVEPDKKYKLFPYYRGAAVFHISEIWDFINENYPGAEPVPLVPKNLL